MLSIPENKSPVMMLGFFVFMACGFVFNTGDAGAKKGATKLLLLSEYDKQQDISGWVVSEKLDGVRAYWNGEQLTTRNGNKINAPDWYLKDFPRFELDGELWIDRNKFAEVSGIVRKQEQIDENWQRVSYQIFEVPNQAGSLFDRLSIIQNYLKTKPVLHLKVIEQLQVNSHHQVQLHLNKVLAKGGEGVVLRNPELSYSKGRVKDAQKVKLKQDAECIVEGYTPGKGKYTGLVGALKCRLIPEQVQRFFPKLSTGSAFIKVGSGLTDKLRKEPPRVGSKITFQYMGFTKNGLPRFPVFLRERL